MGETEPSETGTGRVLVGPPPPRELPPDDLPAVVRDRSDGAERYICYSNAPEVDDVATTRLSIDADVVVSRELWR